LLLGTASYDTRSNSAHAFSFWRAGAAGSIGGNAAVVSGPIGTPQATQLSLNRGNKVLGIGQEVEQSVTITFFDTVPAGTYHYRFAIIKYGSGTGTALISARALTVFEFKQA
jgi:hypothetical protein